jgi:hypothetical protein
MAEPATSTAAVIASALGLTVFGVATGLHPSLLIAGLAGGLWALFYGEPQPLLKRCLSAVMSALVAAWLAPVTAYSVQELPGAPPGLPLDVLQFPVALVIGFLAMAIVGPGLMLLSRKKLDEAVK